MPVSKTVDGGSNPSAPAIKVEKDDYCKIFFMIMLREPDVTGSSPVSLPNMKGLARSVERRQISKKSSCDRFIW